MEASSIEIKALCETDIDALQPLVEEFVHAHPSLSFRKDFWAAFRNWLAKGIGQSNTLSLLATMNGSIAGFIIGDIRDNGPLLSPDVVGHVSVLVVASQLRRKGIGDALWNELRRRFLARGATYFELYTEYGNVNSGPFWHQRGFEIYLEKRRRCF